MKIARVSLALAAMVLAGLPAVAGCAATPRPVQNNTYSWQSLTISLPVGKWFAEEDGRIVILTCPGKPGNFAVQVSPLDDQSRRAQSVLARELFVHFTNKQLSKSSAITIADIPATSFQVIAREGDREVKILAVVLAQRDRVCDFVCWSDPADFDQTSQLFDELLKGVKFKGRL